MKVNIEEGNFTIRVKLGAAFAGDGRVPRKELELPLDSGTLKQLLGELTDKYKFAGRFPVRLVDLRTGEVSRDFGVSVNGVEYELLPERLETGVKQGDELEITMIMLGGG